MPATFYKRTLRNVVLRNHPYFAHLAVTHRCNLRCRFCHIQEARFEELPTDGMKRVIDVLDEMGVAVLSISGGGEPLLRRDVTTILNYAAGKGMYTKLTSNGTMPLERYQRLLESAVKEIGISLDGVDGSDLPFSHVGPKILETIHYLNDHLPPGKQLTLNITVTRANRSQVERIVAYCTKEFPNARIWLNPVVVGDGSLRTSDGSGPDPAYLRSCESPTLLSADFYTKGVEEQHRSERYDWGCRAGRMFFDIKPNGDFWICQDHPPKSLLNILAPDFRERLRRADFSHKRQCSGCTYSCYYVTQRGFEPRNWPGMAGLWWKANTRPDERCRVAAERYGWLSGLFSFCVSRLLPSTATTAGAAFLALLLAAGSLLGQCASPGLDAAQIVARMEAYHASQRQELVSYESTRRYLAENARLGVHAEVTADMTFRAPGEKSFHVLARSGSRSVQKRVIEPAMDAEQKTSVEGERANTEISRRNYTFIFRGLDEGAQAYLFEVEPNRPDRYLFRGKVWLNEATCAIQRIAGEPAQPPSFWVKRVHFVQEYQKLNGFWLPLRHRTEAELRLFGRSDFVIEYLSYR